MSTNTHWMNYTWNDTHTMCTLCMQWCLCVESVFFQHTRLYLIRLKWLFSHNSLTHSSTHQNFVSLSVVHVCSFLNYLTVCWYSEMNKTHTMNATQYIMGTSICPFYAYSHAKIKYFTLCLVSLSSRLFLVVALYSLMCRLWKRWNCFHPDHDEYGTISSTFRTMKRHNKALFFSIRISKIFESAFRAFTFHLFKSMHSTFSRWLFFTLLLVLQKVENM